MADREFMVSLPSDVAERLAAGDDVSAYVREAINEQVRREAIEDYLAACVAAGQAPLTDGHLAEFRALVGEEAPS